ncbi:MAG: hypothetical protein VKJ24_02405 [Synechococcales bacterium]|nr:hypothetical protein [Synechococcales bacterium]
MNIQSIDQESLDVDNGVMTKVVLSHVESQCILTRLAIKAIGRLE